jgi:AraC-like DNA-binding protein
LKIQTFSTSHFAPGDRFEAFSLRIGSMFDMGAPDREQAARFSATIESLNMGTMLVSAMQTHEFVYERSRRRIVRDFIDHLMIRVDLDRPPGEGGRTRSVLIIDLGQVSERNLTPEHNVSVVLPRRIFGSQADALARLHQTPQFHGGALFLGDHLVSIMRHGGDLHGKIPEGVAALTPSLIATCLAPSAGHVSKEAQGDLELALLSRARQIIDDRLASPRLTPDMLARELGVSRSTLYRIFEPAGGVARVIRDARMKAAARAIADLESGVRIGDIAHQFCFSSDAQFTRSFKAHHGYTPSEYRAAVVADRGWTGAVKPAADGRLFPGWLANL